MSEPEDMAQEIRQTTPYDDRLLLAQRTDSEINQAVLQPMLQTGKGFWVLVTGLSLIVAWGVYAWSYLIYWGIGVTGKNRPVYWTLFITTFVFWVGISHAGTMISAVLRLLKVDWRLALHTLPEVGIRLARHRGRVAQNPPRPGHLLDRHHSHLSLGPLDCIV